MGVGYRDSGARGRRPIRKYNIGEENTNYWHSGARGRRPEGYPNCEINETSRQQTSVEFTGFTKQLCDKTDIDEVKEKNLELDL